MSYLARTLRSTRASTQFLLRPTVSSSSFHTTSPALALSEADHATPKDTPSRSSKIESHKQDSISRAESGKGEWKPELASQSEQSVKAEKNDLSIEEMQKMGEREAEGGKRPGGSEGSGKA